MTTLDIYKEEYDIDVENDIYQNKYEWFCGVIFNIVTYDSYLDELFAKKIIEVCEVILNKTNFEYIKDETNYTNYIIVCQLLKSKNWLDWGTSIRGAWFMTGPYGDPILSRRITSSGVQVDFHVDNIKALIDFVKE